MPRIIHEGTGIYSATLLLQWKKENIWIWTGKNQIQTNTNEEPLIIKSKGKEFYFYSTGLEKTENTKERNWNKRYKLDLNIDQKEKIIEKLDKCINHNDWDWKYMLLKYKNNFLKDITEKLTKEKDIISLNSIACSDPKIKKLEKEINYVNQWIKDNQYEIRCLRQNIHSYEDREYKENTANLINRRINMIDASIDNLIKKISELTKKFDSFKNNLINETQSPTKKLKSSQEEIDFNFEIGQETINNLEKKESEEKEANELKKSYLDDFDLEMLK